MRARPIVGIIVLLLAALPQAVNAVPLLVLDPEGVPVPDAVLYVDGAAAATAAPPADVITQAGKQFEPFVLAVRTGTSVRFTNHDPINHHVYSFSAPKQFSVKLLRGQEDAPAVVFDKPGVVVLGCNIHDWMLGYVVVVDSALFATTDAAGRAELALPAGALPVLKVWQPRIENAPIEVTPRLEGGTAVVRVPRLGTDPRPAAVY